MSIKSTFAFVDPATLSTDLRVQRPLDPARVKELIEKPFNAELMGTLIISKRSDGTMIILDGQTRIAAKSKLGIPGNVHAQIYTGLTLAQEASMFLGYNNSKPVSALDKFLVRVTEQDRTAVEVSKIASRYGWTIAAGGNSNGRMQSVAALERIYNRGGAEGEAILDRTLSIIHTAWGNEYSAGNASILQGVAELLLRFGLNAVDASKLSRELQLTQPRAILGRARAMKESKVFSGSLPTIVARSMHTLHNQRMRKNQLPEWK